MSNHDETNDVTIDMKDELTTIEEDDTNEETNDDDVQEDDDTKEDVQEEEDTDDPVPPPNPKDDTLANPTIKKEPTIKKRTTPKPGGDEDTPNPTEKGKKGRLVGYNFNETVSIALHYGFIVIVFIIGGTLLTPDDYNCTVDSIGATKVNSSFITCYPTNDPAMIPVAWTAMVSSILCFLFYTILIGNVMCEFFEAKENRFDVIKEGYPSKFLPKNVRKVILQSSKVVELLSLVTCDYASSLSDVAGFGNLTLILFAGLSSLEICIELFQNAYKQMELRKEPSLSEFVCYHEFYTFLVVMLGMYAFWGFLIAFAVYAVIGLLIFPFIICAVKIVK